MSTVVVTGAAGGIGAAVTARLACHHDLVVSDLDAPALGELAARLCPRVVDCVVADLRDGAGAAELVGRASAAGSLAGLVNVAGVGPAQTSDGLAILDLNLRATARLTEAMAAHLGRGAAVVSIGSVASARAPTDADDLLIDPLDDGWDARWLERSPDAWTAYALSKRGLNLWTMRRAADWAGRGVRLNVVAPSQTATALGWATMANDPAIAEFVARTPMGRMAEPAEVAAAVAFLLGDEASFVTGVELRVDGGAGAAGISLAVPV